MKSDLLRVMLSVAMVVIFCCPGVFAQNKIKPEKISITEDEYEIYKQLGVVNFENATSNSDFSNWVKEQIPNISTEVIADYLAKNSQSYRLRWVLKEGKQKKLTKSPHGSRADGFSRIGFNPDATEALIYTAWSAPGNMCESDFYHLRKEGIKWQVVKKVMVVIC
ncbi:MAG TPA: hypothetical protein VLL54_17285 [Pyrinomonadaceae bacterium]|nr:hypothetical protein [Pyrinomonadaceae bacterium]